MDIQGYVLETLKGAQETVNKAYLLDVETETSDFEVIGARTEAVFMRWHCEPAYRQIWEDPVDISTSNSLHLRDVACARRRVVEAPVLRIFGKAI